MGFTPNNIPSEVSRSSNVVAPLSEKTAKRVWTIIGVVMVVLLIAIAISPTQPPLNPITSINELVSYVQDGSVRSIVVRGGNEVFIRLNNNYVLTLYKERESDLIELLLSFGVTSQQLQEIDYLEQSSDTTGISLFRYIITFVPAIIIIWLLWRMMRASRHTQPSV